MTQRYATALPDLESELDVLRREATIRNFRIVRREGERIGASHAETRRTRREEP